MTKLNIYLDNCCYNRPFDNQDSERIRMESEAILIILKWSDLGRLQIIGSEILLLEVDKNPNLLKKDEVLGLLPDFSEFVKIDDSIISRAKELKGIGLQSYDAIHVSCAEKSNCDLFLTTDDKILKLYKRNHKAINIEIANPLSWLNTRLKK